MADEEKPTVSKVVAGIFAEYEVEPFRLRRQPQPLQREDEKKPPKRPKKEALPLQLLSPEMIRHVAGFLDPFKLMSWSGTCKATYAACSLAFKLDCAFKQFHILKHYADRIHAKGHSWKDVLQVLLGALQKLHNVYGPYQVHPLHAAMIGEALMIHLSRHNNLNVAKHHPRWTFLSCIWNLGNLDSYSERDICEQLACGELSDIDRHEGLWHFQAAIKANPNIIPPGPGRVLAQEGRMPYINVVWDEFPRRGTDFIGFSFQHIEGNTSPYVVFCMNSYSLPDEEDTEAALLEWYSGPKPGCDATVHQGTTPAYDDCTKSIEQAFCQSMIYRECWDDWTQLVRAAWLYAHNIAPFDGRTKIGKELWASVLKVMPEVDPDEDYELTGQEEVLSFSDGLEEDEAEEFARNYAPKYIGLNRDMAKGSDYC